MSDEGVLVFRGSVVESRHAVHLAGVDATGALRWHAGDPKRLTFLRSTAKPFQAAAVVAGGAAGHFGLESRDVAVIAGSHAGTAEHVELVRSILARIGLDETALRCGAHAPLDPAAAARLGSAPTALHHNCSGKHAGMLALALHLGEPPERYLDPDGITQRNVLQTFAAASGLEMDRIAVATDGCGAPAFAVPLEAGARALARLVRPRGELAGALDTVRDAMTAHPELVAGEGRFDTVLMQATQGRLVSKAGAEGVQGVADRDTGVALCIKIDDGASRGVAPATLEALRRILSLPEPPELTNLRAPVLHDHRGRVAGRLEARLRFGGTGGGPS